MGHGNSSTPVSGYRYEDHASDVVGLIQGLGLAAPILLGHSWRHLGGPHVLSPQRQREVHESDVVDQHRRLLSLDKGDVLAQARIRHAHRRPEFVELITEARLKARIGAFDVLTPPNPEYHRLVSTIGVPILLVLGDHGVVSLDTARELRTLTPYLRVEQIKDAGHGAPFDQPGRFEALVKSFLQSVAAS